MHHWLKGELAPLEDNARRYQLILTNSLKSYTIYERNRNNTISLEYS